MAAAVNQNLRLQIGEDRTVTWTITGTDFTGDTVNFWMAPHELAATNTLELTGTGANGSVSVTFADTDTDSLNPAVYYYQLKTTEGGSVETVAAWGSIDLQPARVANP